MSRSELSLSTVTEATGAPSKVVTPSIGAVVNVGLVEEATLAYVGAAGLPVPAVGATGFPVPVVEAAAVGAVIGELTGAPVRAMVCETMTGALTEYCVDTVAASNPPKAARENVAASRGEGSAERSRLDGQLVDTDASVDVNLEIFILIPAMKESMASEASMLEGLLTLTV